MRFNAILGLLVWLAACSSSNKNRDPAEPAFSTQLFSARSSQIDNPYLPFTPERVRVFHADTADGVETTVIETLTATRMVAGVECAIVRDRVFLDELLIEDTHDWYAQDDQGNVWYMGEDVINYEYDDDGNVIGTDNDGAWEAGVDGAEPGFVMKATLQVGDSYRQEYYAGVAEDMGRIVALNVPITLSDGMTYSCLKTRDWTPLDPTAVEFKYYAPGVGLVKEEQEDGSEPAELRGTFDTGDGSLPDISLATFSNPTQITNPYLPFVPETTRTFAVATEDGVETTVVEVLTTTRVVAGIECAVVRDRVFLDEVLVEDTHDWYAQDDAGNVWYLGEDVVNYEYDDMGVLLGTNNDGAWETGVDGAEAGILMWASPTVGQSYRQEFYEDEAEDMAVVIALGVAVDLSNGMSFDDCLQTLEWSPVEPGVLEYKFHALGENVVLEEPLDGSEPVEFLGKFDTGPASLPDISAATFTNPTQITNNYLPLTPGAVFEYEKDTEDGLETILVEVLATTTTVDGIECVVVRDRGYLDGLIQEDTHDWYAQDDAGNVWYLGEDVVNYEYDDDDNLLGTNSDGAWEAGVDGAEAGILMWATPLLGQSYRQEFYEGEAEDMAVVVGMGVMVDLSDGTMYANCLQTLERSPLEPGVLEYKFYAPGVGVVKEQSLTEDEPTELTSAP